MAWTLYNRNCLDVMAELGDRSVDHVICDPPYEAEAHTLQRRVSRAGGNLAIEPLDFAPIADGDRDRFSVQMVRVVRRWIIVFCQAEAVAAWRDALEAAGATYKRSCIWVKPDGMPQLTGDRPGMGYESFVTAHAPGKSAWNGGGRVGVYTYNKNGDARTGHPTQKPELLMRQIVKDFTDPGETILDPFAGSGTTLVAAVMHGRNAIGCELDPKYYEMARKRLEGTREQTEIFATQRKPKPMSFSFASADKPSDAPVQEVNHGDEREEDEASEVPAADGQRQGPARGDVPAGV